MLMKQQIWQAVLKKHPKINLTKKQIYAHWAHIHETTWWLHDDQVTSALMVLKHAEDLHIKIISVPTEDGISLLAFSFKNILEDYVEEIVKLAMDSTCEAIFLFKISVT